MFFIAKIPFVKKKNCPDNFNYYTTDILENTNLDSDGDTDTVSPYG